MSGILVTGWGAVSPAGAGATALRVACEHGVPCPTTTVSHPSRPTPLTLRRVPPPSSRPAFLAHPRLRRSSAISIHAAAATIEALGAKLELVRSGRLRLGIVFTTLTGCVCYSRRFYKEVLEDPATASPIVFPETVFNAPASHLATYLGSTGITYTCIGDPGTFLQGLALAAEWLLDERIDMGLVVGAEEVDWLVSSAQHLFDPGVFVSEGAGALVLERAAGSKSAVQLDRITQPALYTSLTCRETAARHVREAIGMNGGPAILLDSLTGSERFDRAETSAWLGWDGPRLSVKPILGESFAAGSAWQCVLAADQLSRRVYPAAVVNVVGCNQQAIAARFSSSAV